MKEMILLIVILLLPGFIAGCESSHAEKRKSCAVIMSFEDGKTNCDYNQKGDSFYEVNR